MAEAEHAMRLRVEPKASILLVDDNPANLISLRVILESLGQRLVEVSSGGAAIRQVRFEDFAVVLLDMFMPGISGFETARSIRALARASRTPIIFVTAEDVDRQQIEEGYALGAVDFLLKPLMPIAVQAKVRSYVELFLDKQRARQEAEQLRLLVQGTTEYAIFMLDPNGYVATWNPGAQRLKGYGADEIIGQHFSKFYPQEAIDRQWPQHELQVAAAKGAFEDEGWRMRKDGTQFWANVVITALRDDSGKVIGFSKITRDMTERKQSEENARRLIEEATARRVAVENAGIIEEQRELLHVTLSSIGDAVISTDAQGRVTFLNPVAEMLVGWNNEDAAGRDLPEIFRIVNEETRRPVENPALRALQEGVIVGLANHTVLIAKDGTEYPIDDSAAPIRSETGSVIGSILVFRDISEKKQAQDSLRESEAPFRGLMEQAPFSIQVLSPDGRTVRVNKAWEDLWGITLGEIADYNILEDQQLEAKAVLPLIRRAFAGEAVAIPEIEYDPNETIPGRSRHSEPQRWVSAVAYPLRDETNEVREVILVHEDITARRQTDAALRASEERLRRIVNVDGVGVLLWALPEGRLVDANDYFLKMFGYTREEVKTSALTWRHLTPPEYVAISEEQLKDFAATGRVGPYEKEYLRKDGTRAWMVFAGAALGDDTIVEYCIDVSDRKRAEEAQRRSEERYRTLFGQIDEGFCVIEVIFNQGVPIDYRFIEVNPAFEKQTGLTHAAGKTMRELAPDHDVHWFDIYGSVVTTGEPIRFLNEAKALGNRWFEVYAFPLGHGNKAAVLFSNVTDRIHTEQDRERLVTQLRDADRKKDDFIALLAHELRNPLAPIRNGLQVLRLTANDAVAAAQARMMMERQLSHMVRLIDDLLDVSRISRNKMELRRENLLLADVIASAVETARPLIDASGLDLAISLPSQPVFLDADLTRLAQVFSNLLSNSAKYTSQGGRIELTADMRGKDVFVMVRDSGIGIPAHSLPTIFEMFSQVDRTVERSTGGLGIGLALVRGLVEMHGGTVAAESPGEGQGSTFTVTLPMTHASFEAGGSISSERAGLRPARRVLVVDDNEDAATSMAMMLRLLGDEVLASHDGIAAIETAEVFLPEVILMDIGMPRLDGLEATRQIRQASWGKDILIIALTGWGQESDQKRSRLAGCDGHLVKPVSLHDLERLLS